ncbi:MAG TPA: hemolysin family protein [Chitinophagaceae bacterium]|nr:hemolysin family protein [Chitinophagaceae bacterium]
MAHLSNLIYIGITLLLITFFAGIQIAFISANRLNIELRKKKGKRSGALLSQYMDTPSGFLGSTVTGLTVCLVAYGLLVTDSLKMLNITIEWLKLIIDIVIAFIVVSLFAEFLPNTIFRKKTDSLLIFFAPLSKFFYDIFYPVSTFFVNISESLLKYLFNTRIRDKNETFTAIDLVHIDPQSKEEDDTLQEMSTELIENALSLPTVKIRQCLVPRTEIEAVDIRMSIAQVRQKFIESKLSKLVVYSENMDNILGYIHQLDLFKKPLEIKSVLLPIPVVPESMSATDLINKFTRERKSIAWVVDEFGGTAGIVTMEDVLEEIFGDIKDEYDTEEFIEKQISENEYIFSGRLELDYLNEKYHFDFPSNGSETLSGYIINQHETIPGYKERIIIDKYEFDISNVSDTRIEMVKMKILR